MEIKLQSVLAQGHPATFNLTRQLIRYGVGPMVCLATAVTAILSLIFTSLALHLFQGYIDTLGVFIAIAAPVLILPLPAGLFFKMFLKLQLVEQELLERNRSLEQALAEVKTLAGLLPICCCCKKIRDDLGYWQEVEQYIEEHSELRLTHGFCPDCLRKHYPQFDHETKRERMEDQ